MSVEPEPDIFAFAGFSLDRRQRLLFGPDGKAVPLSARAFDTLLYLVERPNQLIDKQMLIKAVWPNVIVEENNLSQCISVVRRALGETPDEHRFVVTVPGRGFRFVSPVSRGEAISRGGIEYRRPPAAFGSHVSSEKGSYHDFYHVTFESRNASDNSRYLRFMQVSGIILRCKPLPTV